MGSATRTRSPGWDLVAVAVGMLPAICGGCTFSQTPLPEGLEVAETGLYGWTPFPYGEGGIHYTFIGPGWLMHDERGDVLRLRQDGTELARVASQGSYGWCLTEAGRRRVRQEGWLAGHSMPGGGSAYIIGCDVLQALEGAGEDADEARVANIDYYWYNPPWLVRLRPIETVGGERPDRAVFLCDVCMRCYIRLATFSSVRHKFVGAAVEPGTNADLITYQLQDLTTGAIHEYRFEHSRIAPRVPAPRVRFEDLPIIGPATSQGATTG